MTKIKTNSKNRFKYGFMAIRASIEGFNSVMRPVIYIDSTHLKARTRGVLLVTVCKDGNKMIYPLAFWFVNSECIESWTWFFKETPLTDPISRPCDVSFGSAQRDEKIWLYYRATYAYCIKEFDRAMAELKETYRKVYDELLAVGVEKFSRVHSPRKRYLSSVLYEMGNNYVYIVFIGRRTGVFNSWTECHEYVNGFPGASYQKFNLTDKAYKVITIRSVHSSHSWPKSSVNVEEKHETRTHKKLVLFCSVVKHLGCVWYGDGTGRDWTGLDWTGQDSCSMTCLECMGQDCGLYCYTFGMAGTGRDKRFK
ncbi:hypothetical protein Dsin_012593 [Dipteronia sinensis]|uniref:Uncharacterized protein n=1 Tax=Dipteronia sinensis TaxID=43782 RepID=A0AAE0AIC9_9ROSI|nr:hypothetical protein Dsin_012593 [Dipteronia sinensis]